MSFRFESAEIDVGSVRLEVTRTTVQRRLTLGAMASRLEKGAREITNHDVPILAPLRQRSRLIQIGGQTRQRTGGRELVERKLEIALQHLLQQQSQICVAIALERQCCR